MAYNGMLSILFDTFGIIAITAIVAVIIPKPLPQTAWFIAALLWAGIFVFFPNMGNNLNFGAVVHNEAYRQPKEKRFGERYIKELSQ